MPKKVVLILVSAATHIMNDDLESAEEGLNQGNSSFHKVRMIFTLAELQ